MPPYEPPIGIFSKTDKSKILSNLKTIFELAGYGDFIIDEAIMMGENETETLNENMNLNKLIESGKSISEINQIMKKTRKEINMLKKIKYLILTTLICFSFVGCGHVQKNIAISEISYNAEKNTYTFFANDESKDMKWVLKPSKPSGDCTRSLMYGQSVSCTGPEGALLIKMIRSDSNDSACTVNKDHIFLGLGTEYTFSLPDEIYDEIFDNWYYQNEELIYTAE